MRKRFTVLIAGVLMLAGSFAAAQEKAGIESDTALPFMIDIEKTAGWMVYAEGGYRWNLFRDVGVHIRSESGKTVYNHKENYTKSGAAGAIALGYNFCPKAPITVGMKLGLGPSNMLEHTNEDGSAYHWQRIRVYTLDFALDYDFKNSSKLTPFVGLNGGLALVSQKARAWYDAKNDGARDDYFYGEYGTNRSVNFMGGGRAGLKYDVNPRVALTLVGQYNYLGSIKGKDFAMKNQSGTAFMRGETEKVKAHMIDAKLGVRIAF